MANARVVLRWMDGEGSGSSSPGRTNTYVLPTVSGEQVAITQIVCTDQGEFVFREEDPQALHSGRDVVVLARIVSSHFSLTLEPLVDQVFVEPLPRSDSAAGGSPDRILIPASKDGERHYLHLRDEDTVNLAQFGLKLVVVVEVPNTELDVMAGPQLNMDDVLVDGAAGQMAGEVQVRSSDSGSPVINGGNDDVGTDTDDDDLNNLSSFMKTPAIGVTPATSRPPTVPTIKETPTGKTAGPSSLADTDTEDPALFSTAHEPQEDPGVLDELPYESPTPAMQQGRKTAKTKRATNITPSADAQEAVYPTEEYGSDVEDEPLKEEKPQKTYGKQGSLRNMPRQTPAFEHQVAITEVDGTSEQVSIYEDDEARDVQPEPMTSEPLSPKEVLRKTAMRSVKRKATSKIDDEDGEDETIVVEPRAKRRKGTPDSAARTPRSDDAMSDQKKPSTSARRGKLSQPNRHSPTRSAKKVTSTTNKRGNSPQVIIDRDTETPTSTAASSILTGKIPKVLLSKDSALRKSAAKWLKDQGAEILDDVKTRRSNFVCVVKDDNVKTAKVLRSLALGKPVVTEDWIKASKNAGHFLDTDEYLHPLVKDTISLDRRTLFGGKTLFFTTALADKVYMSGWQDIVELAQEAGAGAVHKGTSADFDQIGERDAVLCFGADNNDVDVGRLQSQRDCTVYRKTLISHAIITGELDLEDEEFMLPSGAVGGRRKR